MSIKLLVADGHEVVRAGVMKMLEGTDVKVVAQAESGEDALKQLRKHHPDVVLLDMGLGNGDGLQVLSRLKREKPEVPVLLRSASGHAALVPKAVALGAAGFLPKGATTEQYIDSIRAAAAGQMVWTRGEVRRVTIGSGSTPQPTDLESPLTPRESQVLKELALGLTNKQIADKLGISYETIKEHVQHILEKVGVSDRTQAAVWAVRKGLA